MNNYEQASYYAVIPANVRYDKNLRANEKLLYGEISALTNKTGKCWASNKYFADIYGVTTQAVSKWVLNLKKSGYISIDYTYKAGSKEIENRIIKMVSTNVDEVSTNDLEVSTNVDRGINNGLQGYQQKFKENNINNNINNNIFIKKKNIKKKNYGEFENVSLSETEYQKLIDKHGKSVVDDYIEKVSGYCKASGKKYKDYYATVQNWLRKDKPSTKKSTSYSMDDVKKKFNNFD